MTTDTSFWYQAGLNAVGPLVTAIVGSFLIGILVQAITRGAQERRAARELRQALIEELTGVAAKLHVLLQMYLRTKHLTEEAQESMPPRRRWRFRHRTQATSQPQLAMAASWDRVRELRTELDERYLECRRDGEVLEARLVAHFADARVQTAWHAPVDCLIIRYCYAIDFPGFNTVLDCMHTAQVAAFTQACSAPNLTHRTRTCGGSWSERTMSTSRPRPRLCLNCPCAGRGRRHG